MKHINLIIFLVFFVHFSTANNINNSNSWLKSGNLGTKAQPLVDTVLSYPRIGSYTDSNGNIVASQYPITRITRHTLANKIAPLAKYGNVSVLRGKTFDYDNYPPGEALFKKYPSLATKFDKLINLIKTNPKFKALFNKVHLNILNELYNYLMNIYTNFNLQHTGIKEVTTPQGTVGAQFNIPLFLQSEKEYETNKKTLIINHFINIIESQFNGKIRSIMPKIPTLFATSAGKTLIQNDFSIDLTHFIIKQIEPALIDAKKQFLKGLGIYLSFFEEFTSYLKQPYPDVAYQDQFTAFVAIAQDINQFLYGDEDANVTDEDKKIQTVLQKMNPPLFTFNYDDIRALKIIPTIAKSLTPNTKSIQWPAHIVEAANGILFINNHPIAYFTDEYGTVVKEDQAKHLYIVMQAGQNFFQEELLAQPDWLNHWNGILPILQACFGNFSALLGLKILDPCMEALLQNALDTMLGKDVNQTNSFETVCKNYLHQQKITKPQPIHQSLSDTSKNLQNINNVLSNTTTSPSQTPPSIFSDLSSPSEKNSPFSQGPSASDISSTLDNDNNLSSALTQ